MKAARALLLVVSAVVGLGACATGSDPGTSNRSTVDVEPPITVGPTEAPRVINTQPIPSEGLHVDACDGSASCPAGFYLDGEFYALSCRAVNGWFVTDERLAEGDYWGRYAWIHRIEGVDPDLAVAIDLEGGLCADGDEPLSDWSLAIRGTWDPEVLCPVMTLREHERLADGCPDPWVTKLHELEVNRELWESSQIADYQITVSRSCECEYLGRWEVQVTNGAVQSARPLTGGGQEGTASDLWFLTIDGFFDYIEDFIGSAKVSAHLEVEYSNELGYPMSITTDLEPGIADDEVKVFIYEFVTDDSLVSDSP